MAKSNSHKKEPAKSLSTFKFNTKEYVVMNVGVYRDAKTGRLISTKKENEPKKRSS